MHTCPTCKGTRHSNPIRECHSCEGKGYITKEDIKRLSNTCYKCGGQFGPKQVDHYQSRMASLSAMMEVEITFKRCMKCNWCHYS